MDLFQKIVRRFGPSTKMAPTAELSLTQDPIGNSHNNLLVWNQLLNWNQTLIKQSLDGPLPKLCPVVPPSCQDGCTAVLCLRQDPMVNSHKNHLVWNQQLNQNQTLMEQSLDGPLSKLCPAVALSHQDGRQSAVALLLKAALIQLSNYRLLGASCLFFVIFLLAVSKLPEHIRSSHAFQRFVLFNLEFSVQCLWCPFSFILIKLYVFTI